MFILLMKQISKILNQNFLFNLIYCNCIMGKLNSQTFYSKTYTRDSGFHYFSGLATYDDCFYVLSHYIDPEVKNRYGATALLKFDWGGNILQLDSLPPKDGKSFAWPNDLEVSDDSLLYGILTRDHFPVLYKCNEMLDAKMYNMPGVLVAKYIDLMSLESQLVDLYGIKS